MSSLYALLSLGREQRSPSISRSGLPLYQGLRDYILPPRYLEELFLFISCALAVLTEKNLCAKYKELIIRPMNASVVGVYYGIVTSLSFPALLWRLHCSLPNVSTGFDPIKMLLWSS